MRELVVLGTASQSPTRTRNHNGYFLRWDEEGFLFDPGEGTQRQMLFAGVSANQVTRLCLTHFHGDHCLGVPGVVQRMAADHVQHPVFAYFPASGEEYFRRLRHACEFHDVVDVRENPVHGDGPIVTDAFGTLEARRLDHSADAIGYRLIEPDGWRFVPEKLAESGVRGAAIGVLDRFGAIKVGARVVRREDVSERRRGQRVAFIMDTRLCDAVFELAQDVDLLVIEATFLDQDEELAAKYGHLTARHAGRVAAECGVRKLVMTHFSQRYPDLTRHREQAGEVFSGEIVVAEDLMRISVPK